MRMLIRLAASAAALAAMATAQDVEIPFEKFTLDNGLTVVVHEDRKAPIVFTGVWYKVGAKDEPEGKTGFAHLFEHLLFEGSEHVENWDKPLIEAGATGINGTTDADRTNYFQTVPTPALDRALFMESDRMGHFISTVNEQSLTEQRGVVQNEKRQGENAPYGRVYTSIIEGLYPKEHPYGHTTIGSLEDLDNASLEDVRQWFRDYYGPNNAILVLAGDINAEEARPVVEKYFGDIPAGPPLTTWEAWVPDRDFISRETMYDQVPQARIYRIWLAPGDTDPVTTDLSVAASILGDGKNSRLYKDLVYEKQIATDVSVFVNEEMMSSFMGVVVSVKQGESVEEAEAELDRLLKEFLARPPRRDEVELVVTKTRAATIRGLEQVGGFGGKGPTLAQGELIAGDPGYFQRELNELSEATPRSVQEAASAWMRDNYYQLTVLPFDEGSTVAAGYDRADGIPSIDGEANFSFPAVETAELSNGMNLVVATRSTVPLVNIAVQFDAGYAADAGGKLGLANFTAAMLDEGAGNYDALELAKAVEELGATLGSGSNLDTTTVRMSALKENLRPSLNILADVIRRPTFPEEEIERQRTQILTGIAQEKSTPTAIALRTLAPVMYGEGHAYGIPATGTGTEEDVSSVTRADLVRFKDQWMRPDTATIYVVGDTTMAEIQPQLERAFGNWRVSGETPTKNIAQVGFVDPRVILVNRPGSPQSYILAGHIAPPASVDNSVEIDAMNEILGGSFVSRLNMNIREEKGWSYGVSSFLSGARGQRPFVVFAPVQTDKTGASIAEIKGEMTDFLGEVPATAEELNRTVEEAIRSLPGRYETSGDVLGSLLTSGRYGRPYNYPETLTARYRTLDAEKITQAAEDVVRPDQLLWVIVGDAEKIRDEVEAAGLGPVSVMEMSEL